jgi:hypothetical protein
MRRDIVVQAMAREEGDGDGLRLGGRICRVRGRRSVGQNGDGRGSEAPGSGQLGEQGQLGERRGRQGGETGPADDGNCNRVYGGTRGPVSEVVARGAGGFSGPE